VSKGKGRSVWTDSLRCGEMATMDAWMALAARIYLFVREDVEVVDAFSKEADINLEFSLFE